MVITRIQKSHYIEPKCDSASFLPAGIQLIAQRLARKYEVDFVSTDLIDSEQYYDLSFLTQACEPFFQIIRQSGARTGSFRAALLFNVEWHVTPVFYLRDNLLGHQGFFIADALGWSTDECQVTHADLLLKILRTKFPTINCYVVKESRQKQAVGCRTDALVFIRDVMAKRESVYFKTPDLLNALILRSERLVSDGEERENVFSVQLPNIFLKTAQSVQFFEWHYHSAAGAANTAVHARKNGTNETILQFRERYQGLSLLSGKRHYFYLHRKAERFEKIIVKEYYINEVVAALEDIFARNEDKKLSVLADFQSTIYACSPETDFFSFTKNYLRDVIKKEISEKTLYLSKMLFVYSESEVELSEIFEQLRLLRADMGTFLTLFAGVLTAENSVAQRFLTKKLHAQHISVAERDALFTIAWETNQVSSAGLLLSWVGENTPSLLIMNKLLAWGISGKQWLMLYAVVERHDALASVDISLILQEGIKNREWPLVRLLIEKSKSQVGHSREVEAYLLDVTIPAFSRHCMADMFEGTGTRVSPQEAADVLRYVLFLAEMTGLHKVVRDFFSKQTKIDNVFCIMDLMYSARAESLGMCMCHQALIIATRYFPREINFPQALFGLKLPLEKIAFLQMLNGYATQTHSEDFREVLRLVARAVSGSERLNLFVLKRKLNEQGVRNAVADYVFSAKP